MTRLRPIIGILALAIPSVFPAADAKAWERHRTLMPPILSSIQDLPALDQKLPSPCPTEDQARFTELASELKLNPRPKDGVPPTVTDCSKQKTVTGREILAGFATDEPDFGMDQDLPLPPAAYDPLGYQRWMGGTTGPTSQGFRHMYFGGWQLWHPIRTFQLPAGAIGLAPERVGFLARKARQLIREGGTSAAWGYRVLGWAIHYAQDLSQPFHAVQIPALGMVPWDALKAWPPSQGFASLVRETTRTISNYHFAYEAFTLQELGRADSDYLACLEKPVPDAPLSHDPHTDDLAKEPLFLAQRVAKSSVQIAPQVGSGALHFFGTRLKEGGVDLPRNLGAPDYAELAIRPDLVAERDALRKATCAALGDAALASKILIRWATQAP